MRNYYVLKQQNKQQRRAAISIQTAVRVMIARKKYIKIVERRNEAARYIQRIWKRFRLISMVPKAWRKFKYNKLVSIQKYLRGYVVHKRIFNILYEKKLTSTFSYFEKIKAQLRENAQIKIRYYWFRMKRLRKKKEAEDAKKKTKGKNKRPSLVKKGSAVYKNNLGASSKKLGSMTSPTKTDGSHSPTKKQGSNTSIPPETPPIAKTQSEVVNLPSNKFIKDEEIIQEDVQE